MKGFILSLHKAKNEDMIVTVLSEEKIYKLYRFYGARHSILQLGYLIDFEIEEDRYGKFLPRMRGVSHIGIDWLYKRDRLLVWHSFITLLHKHLIDVEDIDRFYFNTLLDTYRRLRKENPKRAVSEAYIKILKFEGRLHSLQRCHICEKPLGDNIALMQSLIPAHPECIYSIALPKNKLISFFNQESSVWLDDNEIDILYSIINRGF